MFESLADIMPELLQIIWLNIVLSGDNAVVIGLAAAGLPAKQRNRAVLFGIVAAAVLRILFSLFATRLLAFWWIDILGGLALLWITWTFVQELREKAEEEEHPETAHHHEKSLMQALWQIIVADVSMSLDNVLAVAAVARGHEMLLVFGLLFSVVLMGVLGGVLARLLERYRIIGWIGVILIAWVGVKLIYEGIEIGNDVMDLGIHMPFRLHED
ncbi:MAG TPA: YjbE family putative metal transport protein [Crenalkalicoccus sp.]|nr:YjbE family putative metal transport protein [Crenalkalicoccus sp.]